MGTKNEGADVIPVLVTRHEWGAEEPNLTKEKLPLPVSELLMTHTRCEECHSQDECIKRVQELQRRDIKKGMPDIQHNFLIGGDNSIYEGRGLKFKATKDTQFKSFTENSIDIGYIGHFKHYQPTTDMTNCTLYLVEFLINNKFLTEPFNITPLCLHDDVHWGKMQMTLDEQKLLKGN